MLRNQRYKTSKPYLDPAAPTGVVFYVHEVTKIYRMGEVTICHDGSCSNFGDYCPEVSIKASTNSSSNAVSCLYTPPSSRTQNAVGSAIVGICQTNWSSCILLWCLGSISYFYSKVNDNWYVRMSSILDLLSY
jgi:hypothetical protein